MAGDSAQKTEKPTPKRLKEAREKGQIARTPDLTTWSAMLATVVLLQITLSRGYTAFTEVLHDMGPTISAADEKEAGRFAIEAFWKGVGVAAPLLLGIMVVGTVASAAQVGLTPNMKRLKPDFSRLNPMKGMKRMVGASAWWEIGKAIAKTAVLVAVAWPAIADMVGLFTTTQGDSLDELAVLTASTGLTILRNVSIAGLAVAAADYVFQKHRITKQLSMSRQEIRDEMKLLEGNPEVKRTIRSRQAAMSRNRMIGTVGIADAVVVNPTHFAVAIKYEATKGAPQIVAKGAGHLALRIREEAAKHEVPVIHEPVLTRHLYKVCDVGDTIPLDLYEAVAHLLAFVFGLRAKGRAHGFHELPRP
ncbi:MAG: EscU/YscU/HrcU family type III secretion system export apparatus switch protein [Actinomycetota bacterium]|nr:EscU/YscU/HrcU family type III secretion system export apparatus switch protein [Actinomycetota bacterium]